MEEKRVDKFNIISKIITIIMVAAITCIVTIAVYIIVTDDKPVKDREANEEYLDRIEEALEIIQQLYYDEIDMDQLMEGAVEGMLDRVDDIYTRYVSKEEYSSLVSGVNETYTGLGIHIAYDSETGGIVIVSTMAGLAGDKQGLQTGDIILKIDDIVVSSKTYYKAINSLKSPEPKTVHLTYLRDDEIKEGDFHTEVVTAQQTFSKVLDNNIGYIRIYSFDMGGAAEFKSHFDSLREKNISGLIIDLRNNPGGVVSEACSMLENILPKGLIVKTVYTDGTEDNVYSKRDNKLDIPLVVLVNGSSASASEIFTGAVKDLEAGTIVGTKTYGKGIVQGVKKLKLSEGAISVTYAKYYTASGIEIHKNGIEPNIVVEPKEEYEKKLYIPYEDDVQLKKAMEIIKDTKK